MSLRKRVTALAATAAVLAVAAPVATAGAATQPVSTRDICLSGVIDFGPLGPYGPYGQYGPYGPDGPYAGRPNPLGNTAQCGGALDYILNGGTLSSFVNANLASVGINGQ